jgi:hypothetical protein
VVALLASVLAPAFADQDSPAGPEVARVNVRLAAPGDVSRAWPHGVREGLAAGGAATGALALTGGLATLAAGPVGASVGILAVGMGVVVVMPMLAVGGYRNAARRDALVRAFEETDFPGRLQRALQWRLAHDPRLPARRDLQVDVDLRGYGLLGGGENLCFSAQAAVRAAAADEVLLEQELALGLVPQHEDLPPGECGSLADFAADDARRARRVLNDGAEVLAAVIVKRLRTPR